MGPVADISVRVKGTTKGAVTDFDGNYAIKAKTGDTLEFTHVSYATVEKVVGASSKIDVTVKESGESLTEVVITAYGNERAKPKSAVAATTISSEKLEAKPNASVIQTLQGQVAGLDIVTGSGQPGATSEINLRGVGSISGSTQPLFIIDGVVVDADIVRSLNSNEISSTSVLKDAGATSIYGSRGANGAIVITTTRGKYNSPMSINITSNTGFSSLQGNNYNLMNAEEELLLEKSYGSGVGSTLTDAEIVAYAKYKNTNWEDVFFRTGTTQDHSVSLRSGGANASSFTSLGYFQQDGVLVDSDLQRFNVRNNLDMKSNNDKFIFSSSVSISFTKANRPTNIGSGYVNRNYALGSLNSLPHLSVNDYVPGAGTDLRSNNSSYGLLALTPIMLLDRLDTFKSFNNELRLLGSIMGEYQINDNFSFMTRLSSDVKESQDITSESSNSFNAQYFKQDGEDYPGRATQSSSRQFTFNMVNRLAYNKLFNEKHDLTIALYSEYFKAHRNLLGFTAQGLDPRQHYPGGSAGFVDDNGNNDFYTDSAFSGINEGGTLSFFGTANYDFTEKYGFGATIRRDASYRFRNTNRWATFYSVSGRWNLDKESFMNDTAFDMLKLRASYGTTGNQRISGSSYFTAANNSESLASLVTGYGNASATGFAQLANPDLKWETVTQANVGIDFGLYNSRYKGTIDVYKKTTSDLFQFIRLPTTSGVTGYFANDGELENTGIELSLFADVIRKKDFTFALSFVGSYNKQARFNSKSTTVEEGGKIGQYYVYRYKGVNPANGNLLFLDKDNNLTENPNPDTDRVFTNKNRYADYQGSFGFETEFKNFYLDARMTYAVGVDRFDFDYQGLMDPTTIGTFRHSTDILDAWTPNNRETNVPSLTASNYDKFIGSDMFLQSADYLRLRMISIGYSVPAKNIEKLKLKSLKAYINGENLMTFSGWRGNDVEGLGSAQYGYPTPKIITLGLKIGI